ncbi:hypothetical protein BDW22DRAFT_1419000 [Trametopsis cervina]|nr:hypothetical protein BDW22DRAFT_1419000 [Trametopsis cervina]
MQAPLPTLPTRIRTMWRTSFEGVGRHVAAVLQDFPFASPPATLLSTVPPPEHPCSRRRWSAIPSHATRRVTGPRRLLPYTTHCLEDDTSTLKCERKMQPPSWPTGRAYTKVVRLGDVHATRVQHRPLGVVARPARLCGQAARLNSLGIVTDQCGELSLGQTHVDTCGYLYRTKSRRRNEKGTMRARGK